MMKKFAVPFIGVLFLSLASCSSSEPTPPEPIIDPVEYVEYACPNEGDIIKIWPDTFILNKDREMYVTAEEKIYNTNYNFAEFALFTCEGKFHDRSKAINSPSSWVVQQKGSEKRDTVWATQGTIYLKKFLHEKDIDEILTFEDGEKVEYGVALLNFNKDTIQASTITFIYKPDFEKP